MALPAQPKSKMTEASTEPSTLKDDFIMVDDNDAIQVIIEPVLNSFGVRYDELDDLMIPLLSNTFANLSTVIPQVLNILAEKKLYDQIIVFATEIGLKNGSCKCAIEKLVANKSMLQRFLGFFAKHFAKQLDPNMGDDISREIISKYIKSFEDKLDQLEQTVNPEAFKKTLDWVNTVHIVFSLVSLAISWKFLFDSVCSINHTSKVITEIRADLHELREKKIKPIFQFLKKTKQKVHITQRDYDLYCEKIDSALQRLKSWRKQVDHEKTLMQNKAVNNTISAVTMGISMFSSFGLNAINPNKALQVIGVLQGITATANVGVAVLSVSAYKKLNTLDNELKKEIEELRKVKKKLAEYLGGNHDITQWDNDKVVEWIMITDTKSAQIFKDVGVEGQDLLEMDDATLDAIGVKNLFHRKKLLRKINELKK